MIAPFSYSIGYSSINSCLSASLTPSLAPIESSKLPIVNGKDGYLLTTILKNSLALFDFKTY